MGPGWWSCSGYAGRKGAGGALLCFLGVFAVCAGRLAPPAFLVVAVVRAGWCQGGPAARPARALRRRRRVLGGRPAAAAELTAQYLVLVAQHQQFGVPGQVRPDQHRQQAEQAPQQPVDN